MILVYHAGVDSKISTPARLGRELHEPRHYQADGHFLALDGPGHVITHDADEICKIPGYRLATPQECDAYYAAQKKASQLAEGASSELAAAESTEDEPPDSDEIETAPTRDRRKK